MIEIMKNLLFFKRARGKKKLLQTIIKLCLVCKKKILNKTEQENENFPNITVFFF